MFDKPTVDSYRRITAPQSLRDKVMAMSEAEEKPVRYFPSRIISIAAAAACLVLVAVSAVLGLPADDITVAYNGAQLTDEPVVIMPDETRPAMASARMTPPVVVTLEVNAGESADISVTCGEIAVYDGEKLVASGTDCTAGGRVSVEWTLSLMPGQTESIVIGGSEYTVTQNGDGISTIREA